MGIDSVKPVRLYAPANLTMSIIAEGVSLITKLFLDENQRFTYDG